MELLTTDEMAVAPAIAILDLITIMNVETLF